MHRVLNGLVLLVLLLLPVPVLHAQDVQWEERRTLLFSILYPAEARATAEEYAGFVDPIYEETATFWGYRPPPPVILRIYPTLDLYYQANPLAEKLPGVVAHAHTGRREISIAIPQTVGQSPEEIQNNVRHELTHIVAADLSGGRLTTPWQEGIAQYVEHPTEQLDRKMELMRQIIAENRLLTWRELNQAGATYADPRVGYPETYTVVAFLIRRDGIEKFRAFVEAIKDSSGYRGALESVYGISADALEREWRAQLDQFATEGYHGNDGSAVEEPTVDLSAVETLMSSGDWSGALRTLRPRMAEIERSGDGEALRNAQSMLARAEVGERAAQSALDARGALLRGDYSSAEQASAAGRQDFESIGMTEQADALAEYAELARRGLDAEAQFSAAGPLLRRLRVWEAQSLLTEAYATFQELGDQPRATQALRALTLITRGQQVLGVACFVCAALLMALSAGRRYTERRMALPYS